MLEEIKKSHRNSVEVCEKHGVKVFVKIRSKSKRHVSFTVSKVGEVSTLSRSGREIIENGQCPYERVLEKVEKFVNTIEPIKKSAESQKDKKFAEVEKKLFKKSARKFK